MKNPFVIIFAIPLYIIKFVLAIVATIVLSFIMAVGMLIFGENGSLSKDGINEVWIWFKQGIF